MKLTTGILAVAMMTMTGAAWGQNPDAIDNARSVAKSLQVIKSNESNAALGLSTPADGQAGKPAAGASAQGATGQAMAKPVSAKPAGAAASTQKTAPAAAQAGKPHDAFAPKKKPAVAAAKARAHKPVAKTVVRATTKIAPDQKAEAAPEAPKAPKPEEKKWAMNGKRDPFFSPVVQAPTGSGCSTGKKCLEIGQINVRGVVKAESGYIAVITNNMNKAYFLHENDPVFNGYVVRITGDSVVFQETVQDKLGKETTHEVVKRITTPSA